MLHVSGFRLPAGFSVSFCLNDKTCIRLITKGFEEKRGQFLREPDPACYNAGFSPVSYFEYTPLRVERGTCGKSGSRFRETRVITSPKKGAVRMKTCLEGIATSQPFAGASRFGRQNENLIRGYCDNSAWIVSTWKDPSE